MRRFLTALLFIGVLCSSYVTSGSAHIRYTCNEPTTPPDPTGICEYFNGNTVNGDLTEVIDPINVVYYPWGDTSRVLPVLHDELGWGDKCGGTQWNRRLIGAPGDLYYQYVSQDLQRASNGCPIISPCDYGEGEGCARYHIRLFQGHVHADPRDNWSVGDAHYEDRDHNIGWGWENAEDYVLENASAYQRGREDYYTFLPRANGRFQNFNSDGWAIRIVGNP